MTRKQRESSGEDRLLAALGNPIRRRVLKLMRGRESVSPRQLSEELGCHVSYIAYHVRVLADCGAITLVGTEPVRGATKHFYRISVKQPWAQKIIDLEGDGQRR